MFCVRARCVPPRHLGDAGMEVFRIVANGAWGQPSPDEQTVARLSVT
jgi:hypothetical protein